MAAWWTDTLLVLLFVLNVFALGTSRIRAVIRIVGAQGLVLGVLTLLVHETLDVRAFAVAALTGTLKGVVIPGMLMRAMKKAQIRLAVEPFISLGASMLLGAVGAGLALAFTRTLPLIAGEEMRLLVPAALTTSFTGFLLLTTRLKAINQVLGYLVLENGIFLFGLLLLEAVPLLVEVGALLDLVVGIFVMGIIIDHIQREFSTMDTRELSSLKE